MLSWYCCYIIWFDKLEAVFIQGCFFSWKNCESFLGTLSFQICLSEFKRKDGLMTHLETHRADSRFVCGVAGCGSGFNQLIHLRKHISSTHSSMLSLNQFRILAWNKSFVSAEYYIDLGMKDKIYFSKCFILEKFRKTSTEFLVSLIWFVIYLVFLFQYLMLTALS